MDAGAMTAKAKGWSTVPALQTCSVDSGKLSGEVWVGSEKTVSLNVVDCLGKTNFLEYVQLKVRLEKFTSIYSQSNAFVSLIVIEVHTATA